MSIWKNKIAKLLERIHYYYPIGYKLINKDYVGYIQYQEILSKKINDIIANKQTNWTSFIELMKNNWEEKVLDMNYYQFPSHIVKLKLKHEICESVERQLSVIANVSLLCNYYTVFFEDHYIFNSHSKKIVKPYHTILFKNDCDVDSLKTFNEMQENIQFFFPTHEFIHHQSLFNYKINGGEPYTESDEFNSKSFCIYNFLFDGFFKIESTDILE